MGEKKFIDLKRHSKLVTYLNSVKSNSTSFQFNAQNTYSDSSAAGQRRVHQSNDAFNDTS